MDFEKLKRYIDAEYRLSVHYSDSKNKECQYHFIKEKDFLRCVKYKTMNRDVLKMGGLLKSFTDIFSKISFTFENNRYTIQKIEVIDDSFKIEKIIDTFDHVSNHASDFPSNHDTLNNGFEPQSPSDYKQQMEQLALFIKNQ